MQPLPLRAERSGRHLIRTLASDEFWVHLVDDICRTLNSVRQHGGFENLCAGWRTGKKAECLSKLTALIAILEEWKIELDRDVASDSCS